MFDTSDSYGGKGTSQKENRQHALHLSYLIGLQWIDDREAHSLYIGSWSDLGWQSSCKGIPCFILSTNVEKE